jgi:hypothetical protein
MMNEIRFCPHCGGNEMIETVQKSSACVASLENTFASQPLYHLVCRNCGSVVRSYVKEPEKLLKKQDRR